MELAIKKAKDVGVAWVTCTGKWVCARIEGAWHLYFCDDAGSNHFGIAGYYSMMAMKEGLIVSFKASPFLMIFIN